MSVNSMVLRIEPLVIGIFYLLGSLNGSIGGGAFVAGLMFWMVALMIKGANSNSVGA
jgi:hypothetical protein